MLPPGWEEMELSEVMQPTQLSKLSKLHKSGKLTQAKIKEIVHQDTSKMTDKVVPAFLVYALMHRLGVTG